MTAKQKILILKTGYSETLMSRTGASCSLGDVFRTTVLLHLFKNDHVTWVTDKAAIPLLAGNPCIDRLLTLESFMALPLETERFDKVINLEKVPDLCALADRLPARDRYGFRFDTETGTAQAHDRAEEALIIANRQDYEKLAGRSCAEILFSMLGARWQGEEYWLSYTPSTKPQFDVGFNTHVGRLIPVKAWPESHWQDLEALAGKRFTITRQQHLDNLYGYMDWINTCRLLVTNDSLGLYLGLALGKKVLALFGPSPATDQSPHPRLRILKPDVERDCMPCLRSECVLGDPCMHHLSPQRVYDAIVQWNTP